MKPDAKRSVSEEDITDNFVEAEPDVGIMNSGWVSDKRDLYFGEDDAEEERHPHTRSDRAR